MQKRKKEIPLFPIIILVVIIIYIIGNRKANIDIISEEKTHTIEFLQNAIMNPERTTFETSGISYINENKTMAIDVTLEYPGDSTIITAHITNNGTEQVKIKEFKILDTENFPFEHKDITVTFQSMTGETLEPNEVCEITFTIKWNPESEVDFATTLIYATFECEQ